MNAVTEVTPLPALSCLAMQELLCQSAREELTTLKAEPAFVAQIGCGVDKNHNAFPDDAIRTQSVQLRKTRDV